MPLEVSIGSPSLDFWMAKVKMRLKLGKERMPWMEVKRNLAGVALFGFDHPL
jgi:hypothetical protein